MDVNIAMVFEALAVTHLGYVKFSLSYLYESCFNHVTEGRTSASPEMVTSPSLHNV